MKYSFYEPNHDEGAVVPALMCVLRFFFPIISKTIVFHVDEGIFLCEV